MKYWFSKIELTINSTPNSNNKTGTCWGSSQRSPDTLAGLNWGPTAN